MATNTKKAPARRTKRPARRAIKHNGITLIPGDPSVDISDVPGVWAGRDDITIESLRQKAWGHGDR